MALDGFDWDDGNRDKVRSTAFPSLKSRPYSLGRQESHLTKGIPKRKTDTSQWAGDSQGRVMFV